MELTSEPTARNQIRSFEKGMVKLRDRVISKHVIISSDQIIEDWSPAPVDQLSIEDFAKVLDLKPEVILFGTGMQQQFPDIHLVTEIMQQGIAIEVMETHAACRTFNVLVGERRAVVAALLVE